MELALEAMEEGTIIWNALDAIVSGKVEIDLHELDYASNPAITSQQQIREIAERVRNRLGDVMEED